MAAIKEILEIENGRKTAEDWQVIHLFQEGSFYRAYEVSAWLCHRHISEFKVTHRHLKGIEESVAFVGFPVLNLEKRTPEGATVETLAEKHLAMRLPMQGTEDAEAMAAEFGQWKQQWPVTEKKDDDEAPRPPRQTAHQQPTLFSIAQTILAYPIEHHSPLDCIMFLADVKRNLTKII